MRWNSETKARLIDPWERGLSIGSIFQRVGRTPSTVKSQASKLRLRRQTGDRSRFAPVTADVKICCTVTNDLQLLSLMVARIDVEDIGRRLGQTMTAVETR